MSKLTSLDGLFAGRYFNRDVLGFKRYGSAATMIARIELMHRIRKGQFNLSVPGLKDAAAPDVWNAVQLYR